MSSVTWISAIDTHDSIRFLSFSAPCLPQQAKQRNRLRWRGWSRTQSAIRIGILGSETGSFTTKWPFKYHSEMWKFWVSDWICCFFPIFFWHPHMQHKECSIHWRHQIPSHLSTHPSPVTRENHRSPGQVVPGTWGWVVSIDICMYLYKIIYIYVI